MAGRLARSSLRGVRTSRDSILREAFRQGQEESDRGAERESGFRQKRASPRSPQVNPSCPLPGRSMGEIPV